MTRELLRDDEPQPESPITAGGHPSGVKQTDEQATSKVAEWAIGGIALGGVIGAVSALIVYTISPGGDAGAGVAPAILGGLFVGAATGGMVFGRLELDDRAVTQPTYRSIRSLPPRTGPRQ